MARRSRSVLAKLSSPVAGQFAHPHGPAALVMAPFLNVANRRINRAAIEGLAITPGERILDIGFGGGIGMRFTLERLGDGWVTGVDMSPEVVARARRAFRGEISQGRVALLEGSVDHLPVSARSFDGACTVNTIYFWPDVLAGLAEIRRVLAARGRLVIAMASGARRETRVFWGGTPPSPNVLAGLLHETGFTAVDVHTRRGGIELVVGHTT